jgi:hypothetical protein
MYISTCFERPFRSSSGVHYLLNQQLCTNHADVSRFVCMVCTFRSSSGVHYLLNQQLCTNHANVSRFVCMVCTFRSSSGVHYLLNQQLCTNHANVFETRFHGSYRAADTVNHELLMMNEMVFETCRVVHKL